MKPPTESDTLSKSEMKFLKRRKCYRYFVLICCGIILAGELHIWCKDYGYFSSNASLFGDNVVIYAGFAIIVINAYMERLKYDRIIDKLLSKRNEAS